MKKRGARETSTIVDFNRPLSCPPPYIESPDFKFYLGEASVLLKAEFANLSAKSIQVLREAVDSETLAIFDWLMAELMEAVVEPANENDGLPP